MNARVLTAALVIACPVGPDVFGQSGLPDHSEPGSGDLGNPRQRRALRELAVRKAGPGARALVESGHGDDAARALLACSPPVAARLAAFHASGGLDCLPRPRDVLRVIARPGCGDDVAVWVMLSAADLTDPDACDAFLDAPLEFAMGLKDLVAATAERRRQRLSPPRPIRPDLAPPVNHQGEVWAGVLGLVGILIIWRARHNRSRDAPA